MAFSGDRQPFQGAGADAVPDQNVLLARMRGGTAESHVTHLAGLGSAVRQAHFFLSCLAAVRSICHPDQRRHSISAAVRH